MTPFAKSSFKIIVIRARPIGDFVVRFSGTPGRDTTMRGVLWKGKAKGACRRAKRNGVPNANRKRLQEIFFDAFSLNFDAFDAGGAE